MRCFRREPDPPQPLLPSWVKRYESSQYALLSSTTRTTPPSLTTMRLSIVPVITVAPAASPHNPRRRNRLRHENSTRLQPLLQSQHEQVARNNRTLLASENHGQPSIAATPKPGVFSGSGVVAAHAASVNANRPQANANSANHNPARGERPPYANNTKAVPSPATAKTSSTHPNQSQHGSNHPPSNAPHPNEAHPNNPRQNNNHPAPHPSEGHPGNLGR